MTKLTRAGSGRSDHPARRQRYVARPVPDPSKNDYVSLSGNAPVVGHKALVRVSMPRIHSLFFIVILAFALAACGDDDGGPCTSMADCPTGNRCVDRTCTAAADSGPRDMSSGDAGTDLGADAGDGGPPIGAGCSADLRDVLTFGGGVLRTCPADQGCAGGTCVPACDAAAASRGSIGCAYVAMTPPSYPPELPPCHAVFLAHTWARPVQVTVERAGTRYDVALFGRLVDNARAPALWDPVPATGIPMNEVAVLFLSSDPTAVMPETGTALTCPVTPAIDASTAIEGTGAGDAWTISTDTPVSAYDIAPFGGAPSFFPSASLLLPTTALGADYVVMAPPAGTASAPGPLWISVIGTIDATTVNIAPVIALPAGGSVPAAAAGATTTTVVNAGRIIQWELPAGATVDTSGSLISASHPIAVVTGNRFLRLQPAPGPGGEGAHQQILPVEALGSSYVAAPYTTRRADLAAETIPYRMVGAVDGTALTYDPPVPGPSTLGRGQVADFETALAFRVLSQDAMHPFALAQQMTTANLVGGSRVGADNSRFGPQLGDEEFVITFPQAQFLSRYVFFTDPTYFTTNLALTRTRALGGTFADVSVDCLGVVGGWLPVGAGGNTEVTTVDLVRANVGVGTCTNGRHVASSTAPFGVVVWGTDAYASYAYPAGGNAQVLADLPPLI